jgi:serine phosphatase RsbU (regulator of sigma subunit)
MKESDSYFMASLDLDLGEAYMLLKNYPIAFDYLENAKAIIESNDYNELKLAYLELLATYYKETGFPDLAYSTILQYNTCKDSLDLINNRHRISELNARYEAEKRETEIARQAQLIEKKSAEFGTVLMAAFGVSLIAIFILISLVRKRRMNRMLQEQNAEIVMQRQKIISSINYARRIQSSILPDSDLLKNLVSDAFIYFKPRDIVSGDFYWYKEIDDQLYIATVDCTGHGVPGAFMSLIANAKLNKVVMEMGVREPGQILTQVHHEIVQSLRQSEDSQSSQDGMDISLCLIDFKTRKIKFSGANSSVFLKTEEGLQEIKSKPLSIGGQLFNRLVATGSNVFETVDVEYSIGDRLFMYTDGFPDQLGGDEQKKLNKTRFKSLLDMLSLKDFNTAHEHCEYVLTDWRKSLPQTDDILLVGIRL